MSDSVEVLVIGAGFAGMAAIVQLREQGLDVRGVEKGDDVGGTWYWNRYPGLRCDIESMRYSYSWDDSLQQEWTWRERYAAQPEILSYARHVADRYSLRPLIRFGVSVVAMRFDEDDDRWSVELSDGTTVTSQWVVLATGALSKPKPVDIPGADSFAGEVYHTSDWPEDQVSFAGKRVAVIGTGSSGIQVSTAIAKDVGRLHVLQRTPSYTVPAHNRPLSGEEVSRWKADYTEIRESSKKSIDGLDLPSTGKGAFDVDDDERRAHYEEVYGAGVPFAFFGVFTDILTDERANQTVADFLADKIRERVDDPEVAEKLVPSGSPFGTRRACIDTGYYEIFNQDNVELVALRETPIVRVDATGILTTGGHIDLDAIVYATGYDLITGSPTSISIERPDGLTLADVWAGGARSYLGLMVAGFPNLFLVTGPQSPSVMSNMFVSIEQHVEWIVRAIVDARREGVSRMEADPDAEQAWIDHAAEVAQSTLYRKATSYYVGANVPGKAHVVLPYLGGVGNFRDYCDQVAADGYRGFVRSVHATA